MLEDATCAELNGNYSIETGHSAEGCGTKKLVFERNVFIGKDFLDLILTIALL